MASTIIVSGGAIINGVLMTGNLTSSTMDVQGAGVAGIQVVAASATHVGTVTVELSNDDSTWKATGFIIAAGTLATSVAASNGAALSEMLTVDVAAAKFMRVKYTFSSGTGTLYLFAHKKPIASSPRRSGAVSGTVTANAGTNLNTSALATQATLAAQSAKLPATLGVKAGAASLSVGLSTEDAAVQAKLEARIAQPNMLVAPTIVAIDTSSAAATALTVGTPYMVYVTAPCFVEVGPDAVAAEATNTLIEPGDRFVWTPTADNTDDGIACIAAVAGGSMYVQACQA